MKKLLLSILAVISTATLPAAEIVAIAHPWEKLPHDKTVIWTPLFQAAWDDLHQSLGEPVKVEPPSVLMDRLDHFVWTSDSVMPRNCWKVWAGEGTQELIDKANAEAARLTGEKTGPVKIVPRPDARIALGLLDRNLLFKKALYRSENVPLEFHLADGTTPKVRFFGARRKASGARVEVEMGMAPFGEPPPPPQMIPRFFHYDRPFFVFLWRDQAEWPYFGAWIGDSSALEEFKAP